MKKHSFIIFFLCIILLFVGCVHKENPRDFGCHYKETISFGDMTDESKQYILNLKNNNFTDHDLYTLSFLEITLGYANYLWGGEEYERVIPIRGEPKKVWRFLYTTWKNWGPNKIISNDEFEEINKAFEYILTNDASKQKHGHEIFISIYKKLENITA